MEKISIKNFSGVFKGITIHSPELNIQVVSDILSDNYLGEMPLLRVEHNMTAKSNENTKIISGNVMVVFRNDRKDTQAALIVDGVFSLSGNITLSAGEIFRQSLYHLHQSVEGLIIKHKLIDGNGELLSIWPFPFAENHFKKEFKKMDKLLKKQ